MTTLEARVKTGRLIEKIKNNREFANRLGLNVRPGKENKNEREDLVEIHRPGSSDPLRHISGLDDLALIATAVVPLLKSTGLLKPADTTKDAS